MFTRVWVVARGVNFAVRFGSILGTAQGTCFHPKERERESEKETKSEKVARWNIAWRKLRGTLYPIENAREREKDGTRHFIRRLPISGAPVFSSPSPPFQNISFPNASSSRWITNLSITSLSYVWCRTATRDETTELVRTGAEQFCLPWIHLTSRSRSFILRTLLVSLVTRCSVFDISVSSSSSHSFPVQHFPILYDLGCMSKNRRLIAFNFLSNFRRVILILFSSIIYLVWLVLLSKLRRVINVEQNIFSELNES